MITVGIDYSITGPALCIHTGEEWSIENCTFSYLTGVKKNEGYYFDSQVLGMTNGDKAGWEGPLDRYWYRADWVIECIASTMILNPGEEVEVAMEGFSFNSKGKIDSIIENATVLKIHLHEEVKYPEIYPPATIKKFATGKGNALKEGMFAAFLDETGWDLHEVITPDKKKIDSPVSDIVDAYYICKLHHEEIMNER